MTKVLLAEDDADWLAVLQRRLIRNGFEVVPVTDSAGVESKAPEVDALVIDVMLGRPAGDILGAVAVANLLREDLVSPRAPVVFISGLGEGDNEKFPELKIPRDRYVWLQKPFEEEHLIDTIREQLEARSDA